MSSQEFDFTPDPLDVDAIASNTLADLAAFNQYVEQEISGIRLFGAIMRKISEKRSGETCVQTDIAAGKVGLEVAELAGKLPERLTDPNTPIVQNIYYPPVHLPDGNHALLSEVVHRREGIDSAVVARIPWLHILSEEALTDFQNGEVDCVTDVALETYSQSNFDRTGRTDDEVPFSDAQSVFFSHPLEDRAVSNLELDRQLLLQEQSAYMARLQTIAGVVMGMAQES
jgi:hypothetical protein